MGAYTKEPGTFILGVGPFASKADVLDRGLGEVVAAVALWVNALRTNEDIDRLNKLEMDLMILFYPDEQDEQDGDNDNSQ